MIQTLLVRRSCSGLFAELDQQQSKRHRGTWPGTHAMSEWSIANKLMMDFSKEQDLSHVVSSTAVPACTDVLFGALSTFDHSSALTSFSDRGDTHEGEVCSVLQHGSVRVSNTK